MKKIILLITTILLFNQIDIYSQQTNPVIQNIINEVNVDTLIHYVEVLSGEVETIIFGEPYTITSRNVIHNGNEKAGDYITMKLMEYGYFPVNDPPNQLMRNVIAIQTGTEYPDHYYLICAHYDSMPIGNISPGADDNGSGTAAVLEAARVLSKYQPKYSIIYLLTDNEESGMLGSYHYVQNAVNNNVNIVGVINLDMIAYDYNDDNIMEIHTNAIANTFDLYEEAVAVNDDYNIGLTIREIYPGSSRSDHYPFWVAGYGAIMMIEDYFFEVNSNYHTVYDKVSEFNVDYYHDISKLAIGTLASLAGVDNIYTTAEGDELNRDFYLSQNYPNPFNPSTTIQYYLQEESRVKIGLFNILGVEIATLVDETKHAGNHQIMFNSESVRGGLSSGVYFYRIETDRFTNMKKMILAK